MVLTVSKHPQPSATLAEAQRELGAAQRAVSVEVASHIVDLMQLRAFATLKRLPGAQALADILEAAHQWDLAGRAFSATVNQEER